MLLHARGAASTASPLRKRAARAAGKTMGCAEGWGAGGSLLMCVAIHHRMHGKCWGVTPWDTAAVGQTPDSHMESKFPQFDCTACAENADPRWDKQLAHCIWHHKAPRGAKGQRGLRKKSNHRYLGPDEGAVCWQRGAHPGEAASRPDKVKQEEGKCLVCHHIMFSVLFQNCEAEAKDRAWLRSDSGHAKLLALGLCSISRITFRNRSISAHKGCNSSPLKHLNVSMSCIIVLPMGDYWSSPWPPLRNGSPHISSLLACPDSHLQLPALRICT